MPWILDTDLVTILQRKSQPAYDRLAGKLKQHSEDEIWVSVVSFQEQAKGWLALLNRVRSTSQILQAYDDLASFLRYFCRARILPFDQFAQNCFEDLRARRIRLGTMDLRIASAALATKSTLLSRNTGDFKRVPGLSVEDWTE